MVHRATWRCSSTAGFLGGRGPQLAPELAKLYLFDDLGVSQRWANKFSEAGIEMVGDLVGKTEDELFRIEGIGVKAIEELRAGLEARDLLYILDDPKKSDEPDASQLLEMLFSPEDAMYMGAEVPQSYSADPDDFIGTAPQRHSSSDEAVLNELLGGLPTPDSAHGRGIREAGECAGRRRTHRLRLSSIFSPKHADRKPPVT